MEERAKVLGQQLKEAGVTDVQINELGEIMGASNEDCCGCGWVGQLLEALSEAFEPPSNKQTT